MTAKISVRCVETGEIFESYRAAEENLNLAKGTISQYFANELKHVRGLTFVEDPVRPEVFRSILPRRKRYAR